MARSTPLLTSEGTASLHSRQIAQWRLIITTDDVFPFTDGHACQAQKLPWKSPCVLYFETLFTKELLPRSLTIYTAAPNDQKKYYTNTTVLQALSKCILGWIWNSGTLQASQHRIATLASFSKPETVGRPLLVRTKFY